MIYREVELSEWCSRNKLESVECLCKCGVRSFAIVPVETKKSYGLVTEDHGCGNEKGYTFVPKSVEMKNIIMRILKRTTGRGSDV